MLPGGAAGSLALRQFVPSLRCHAECSCRVGLYIYLAFHVNVENVEDDTSTHDDDDNSQTSLDVTGDIMVVSGANSVIQWGH